MFDTVGKNRKANRRRQTGALILSVILIGSAFSALLFAGRQIVEEVAEEAVVEVTFMDDMAAPPPPASCTQTLVRTRV